MIDRNFMRAYDKVISGNTRELLEGTAADSPASIDKIIAYEQGELEREDVIALFQELVNTGLAWKLQGHYGRMAKHLIDMGEIELPGSTASDDVVTEEIRRNVSRSEMMRLIQDQFPKVWMRNSEEFSGHRGGIWSGEGSEVVDDEGLELPVFDYYAEDPDEIYYTSGIYKPFYNLLRDNGWMVEFHDPGTVSMFPA